MATDSGATRPPPRADSKDREAQRSAFIEEMGQLLGSFGMPHTAGRILAALLVAIPPEQTAGQLAAQLQVSRGSISTMTRLLEAPGLIERVRKPGDRKVYYRNTPDAWQRAMAREAAAMRSMRTLAERGAALMADEAPEARRGIEDTVAFLTYWEREMGRVLANMRAYLEGSEEP